jgi:hypothetical protein
MRLRWIVLAAIAFSLLFILALILYNQMLITEAEGVTYALPYCAPASLASTSSYSYA